MGGVSGALWNAQHGTALARPSKVQRDHFLRAAAIGLVVYGIFGFVLLGLAYVVASRSFDQIESLRRSLEDQRSALVGSLRATSQTLNMASTTFDDFGAT